MRERFFPRAAVSGVGSLPEVDVMQALRTVFEESPEIPFWPQLPRRSAAEHMLCQPFWRACEVIEPPLGARPPAIRSGGLETFLELLNTGEAVFLNEAAPGFFSFLGELTGEKVSRARAVKAQCVGPVTVLRGLRCDNEPLANRPEAVLGVTSFLGRHAAWQITSLSAIHLPVIFVFDEPLLGVGSRKGFGESDDAVLETALKQVIARARLHHAIVGIHSCGTIDLDRLLRFGADLISFDVSRIEGDLASSLASPSMREFLDQGGMIMLGVVDPVAPKRVSPERMREQILAAVTGAGLDPALFFRQTLVSAGCGLGFIESDDAEEVWRMCQAVSDRLKRLLD